MWPISSSSTSTRPSGGNTPPPPSLGYGIPPELGMFVAFHHPAAAAAAVTHQQHHHHHHVVDPMLLSGSGDPSAATALGVGVIPLLTASPAMDEAGGRSGGGGGNSAIHLWQAQQQQQHQHNFTPPHEVNYLKKAAGDNSISFDQQQHHNTNNNVFNVNGNNNSGGGGGSGLSGTLTCQDCGNQAKKDCSHRRCRTCCRSRGFDCSTHVKSTWVPAARRRERQVMGVNSRLSGGGGDGASSGSTSGAKKPRLITSQNTTTTSHTSASNTPPRSYDTSSSHQDAGLKERLPGQVRAPAVFKCVRVSAVDDGSEDEYAYQAVVRIGGHVFKGFLYDQGMESRQGFPNLSDLHLNRHAGVAGPSSSNNPLLDPSDVYGGAAAGASNAGGDGILGFGNAIG